VSARCSPGHWRGSRTAGSPGLEAWLFGIAKNVLKDRYEAKRVAAAGLPDDLPAPPVDSPLELDCPDLPDRISDYEVPATRSPTRST
jgi:DNA-directed RNA polymerase specialized sigma24 family protein